MVRRSADRQIDAKRTAPPPESAGAASTPPFSYIRTFKEPSSGSLPSALDSHQVCCLIDVRRQAPAGSCDCSPSPPVETFTPPRELSPVALAIGQIMPRRRCGGNLHLGSDPDAASIWRRRRELAHSDRAV